MIEPAGISYAFPDFIIPSDGVAKYDLSKLPEFPTDTDVGILPTFLY